MQIAVVIPTYNRYKLLQRAINSIFAQTYKPSEIIVVDDGSTDNTSNIKKEFPSVKYIYQKNSGVSSARNRGIKSVCSEWIAFLDSDDEWYPTKLEEQVKFHQKYSDIFMSYTDETWIRDGVSVHIPKKFKKIGEDVFAENLSCCHIAPSSVLLHRNLFDLVGMFDERLEVCEDYDLWLRISLNHTVALVDQKLIKKYAGHEDQLSFKYWGMDRFRVITLEKFLVDTNSLDPKKKICIKKELLRKYSLLLKGALKHNRDKDVETYREKIVKFRLV